MSDPMKRPADRNLWDFRREFERFFDEFWRREEGFARGAWNPAVELSEADGAFHLFVEMPGVRREDVKVEVRHNEITITGKRGSDKRQGAFYRSLALPAGIDGEGVEAAMDHGVLEIRAPRAEGDAPREVPVLSSFTPRGLAVKETAAPAGAKVRADERSRRIESSGDSECYAS